MQGFWNKLIRILTDPACVGAVIAAVIGAFANKSRKENSENNTSNTKGAYDHISGDSETIKIPPEQDPFFRIKNGILDLDIDKKKFGTEEYWDALATRLEMIKRPKSRAEVGHRKDG